MRLLPVIALCSAIAAPAAAQQIGPVSEITITVADSVKRDDDRIGEREIDFLKMGLREAVEERVAMGAGGGQLNLVIENASPNRPTHTQMRRTPGISFIHSFSIGGAEITGTYVAADGTETPVHYRYYETDIRDAQLVSTWHDADRAFRRFAQRLNEG